VDDVRTSENVDDNNEALEPDDLDHEKGAGFSVDEETERIMMNGGCEEVGVRIIQGTHDSEE
jgi:hypothetical protein